MSSNQLQAGGFREPLASRSVNDLHRINPVDISIRKMERALTDNDWIISRPDANRSWIKQGASPRTNLDPQMVPCRGKDQSPTTSVSSFHHPFEFDPPSPSRSHLSSPPPTSQNRLDLPPIPLPLPPLVDQTTYDPLRQMTQFLGPDHLTQDDASDPSAPDTSVTTPNEEVEFDNETQLQSDYRIPGELPKDNVELELAIMDHGHLPATTITNPDDGTDGVFMSTGQDRFLNILKSDQVSEENHLNGLAGYEVFWDEREPGDLIAVLENCGPRPTLLDNRRAEDARHFQRGAQISARKPFDPKAPHFDIVIISLPNSPYFPQKREAVRRLSPNPMDRLPLESLLGRPGFVILHVGNTPAGLAEGLRLFSVWSVKRLENVTWMPTRISNVLPEGFLRGLFRGGQETFLLGMRGTAKRSQDTHILHCCVKGDLIVQRDLPNMIDFAESFSLGQRRLHIFARPEDFRPGWINVGRNIRQTTFDCRRFTGLFEGRNSWLLPHSQEIEFMRPKTPEADKDAIEIISNGLPELLSVGGELGHNSSGQLELVAPRPVRPDSRGAVMLRTVEQEAHNAQFGYYETSRDIPQSFYDERTASLSRQASTELVGGNASSGTINTSTVPVFNQASTPGVTNHSNEPLGPSNYNGSGYNSGRSNEPLGTSGPSYNSSSGPATSHSRELLGTAGPSGHSSASQPLGVPGPSGYNRRDATVQHDRTPTPNIPRNRQSNSGFNPDSPEFVPGAHQHQIPDLDVEPTPPPSEPSSSTEEAPPVHKRQRRVYDGHGDDLFTLDTGSAESLRRAASVTGVPRRTPRPPRATAARNNNSSSTPTGSNTQSPQATQEPASPTVELPVRERSVQPSRDQGTRRVRDHHIQDSQSSLSSNFPNRRVNVQTVVGRQGDAPVGTLPLANTHNNAGANTISGVSAGPGGPNMVVPDMPQQQRQNRALEIREQRQRAMNIRDVHMRNTLLQHLEGTVAAPLGLGGVRNPLNGQPAPVRTNGNFIIEPPRIIVPVPGPHALVARPRGNHMHNVEEPEMPAPARTHNIQDMPTPVGNAPRQANVRPPPMGQFNIFDIQGQTRAHPQGTVGTDTNQTPQVPNRPTAFQAWNAPRNLPIALALGTPRPIENINARRNDGVANMNRILGNQGFNAPQPAAFPTQPQFAQPNVARFPTIPPQDPWGHLTGNTTGAGFDNSGPSVFANPLRLPEDRPDDGFPRLFNFNTMMPVFPAEEPQPIAAQQPEPEIGLRSVSGNALNGFLVEREARRARDDEHIQQQLEDERAHAAQLEHEAAMTAEYIRHLQQLLERRDRQRRGE